MLCTNNANTEVFFHEDWLLLPEQVLGTLPSEGSSWLPHLVRRMALPGCVVTIDTLHRRTLRHRESRRLAQDHTGTQ